MLFKQEKHAKKGIKRILSAVVTFFLITVILLSLVVVVKTSLADDPSVLGFRFFYIVSGSMEPTIPVGAVVITKRQSAYAVDDVITFRSTNDAIYDCPNTHRIVSVSQTDAGPVYVTKGDANNVPDAELVPLSDVYGKAVIITPSLSAVGSFLEFLLTPSGFFILLVVPMLLITVAAMKEFAKNCQAALRQQAQALQADQTSVPEGEENSSKTSENDKEKGSGNAP